MKTSDITGKTVTPVADLHCDTISEIAYSKERKEKPSITLFSNQLHLDLLKMKEGNYLVQNFAMYVNTKDRGNPLEWCLHLIDVFYEEMERNQAWIRQVYCYQDIFRNHKEGRMSALLAIEEGGTALGSLSLLRTFYRLGVRMLTLTWNYENELAYPNAVLPEGGQSEWDCPNTVSGLKERGIEFIQEMERLGMMIDVSHLSDAGFFDVLLYTRKPFVASHSNARGKCRHFRNMSDDMIRSLANRGGVMGLNYAPCFLFDKGEIRDHVMERMVEQVKYILSVGGNECLGLGSDFDGISTNEAIPNASYLPQFAEYLHLAGLSSNTIDAIFYKNVMRVYQEVLQ